MLYLLPGEITRIEIFLIALIVALIGAGGYVFFIFSMHADRNARLREIRGNSPWEKLGVQETPPAPKKLTLTKGFWIWLIALALSVLLLILFELAVNGKWQIAFY